MNNKSLAPTVEQRKIGDIIKKMELHGTYCRDGKHNIFKRVDRYKPKKKLIIIFSILSFYNLFEIFYYLYFLFIDKITHSDQLSTFVKFITELLSIINLGAIICLSWLTFTKLKIESMVFY